MWRGARAARGLSRVLLLHLALHLQPARALAKAEAWDACAGDPLYAAAQPLAPALRAWRRWRPGPHWRAAWAGRAGSDTRALLQWPPPAGEAAVRAACAALSAAWGPAAAGAREDDADVAARCCAR